MIVIHEGDTLEVEVTVTDDAEQPFDLTGAALAAAAPKGGTVVAAAVTATDPLQGLLLATLPAGALGRGRWTFQARVTTAAISRIVADEAVEVRPAIV